MSFLNYKETLERLRQSGLTGREIRRLQKFYRRYALNEMDLSSLDRRRLEFARWLVTTHRLSDQINPNSDANE
jgi:hypothetical protein